jgi:hypothetical protein
MIINTYVYFSGRFGTDPVNAFQTTFRFVRCHYTVQLIRPAFSVELDKIIFVIIPYRTTYNTTAVIVFDQ